MDPLDEVFSAMRVESALYARLEAGAPWGVSFAAGESAKFGLVLRGGCWLSVEGRARPLALAAGDCYLLTGGSSYLLRDDPRSATRSCAELIRNNIGGLVELGGKGARTTIISGWFRFDPQSARPFIERLPPVIHVRLDQGRASQLQTALQLFASETAEGGIGSGVMVSRLADILFIQAIRAHLATREGADAGWLAALADPRIGAALRAMHSDLRRSWTVESLAQAAGLSRSGFALRFKERVGEAPLEYLTRWRMFRAGTLLRQSDRGLSEIAGLVGYESEASFSKAFKRLHGVSPGGHRRGQPPPTRASRRAS
jgi:AraC-like DNA-binding protein